MPALPCPHCTAILKTSSPLSAGISVRCPKCGKAFTTSSVSPPQPLSLDDAPAPRPARRRYDDDEESRGRGREDDHSPIRGSAGGNGKLFAMIGGGILAVGLIAGLVLYFIHDRKDEKGNGAGDAAGGASVSELINYLPAGADSVTFYNFESLSQVKQFETSFNDRIKNQPDFEVLSSAGLSVTDLSRAATCYLEKGGVTWVFVAKNPFEQNKILKDAQELTANERKYYRLAGKRFGGGFVHFASETMIVAASNEATIKSILEREPGKAAISTELQSLMTKASGASYCRVEIKRADRNLLKFEKRNPDLENASRGVSGILTETRVSGSTLYRTETFKCAKADDANKIMGYLQNELDTAKKNKGAVASNSKDRKAIPAQTEARRRMLESISIRASGSEVVISEQIDIKPWENEKFVPFLPY